MTTPESTPTVLPSSAASGSSPTATAQPTPNAVALSGTLPAGGQDRAATPTCAAPGHDHPDGHTGIDVHDPAAVGDSAPPPAHGPSEAHTWLDGWRELRIWAEMYEDAQKARIACTNRAQRGGLDPEVYGPQLDAMSRAENEMGKAMRRCYRRVVPAPIREWQQDTPGIGEHLLARLLGTIGHPVHATPHRWEGEAAHRTLIALPPFDRNPAKLWAYCGHGDATRKRRKGMAADEAAALGNPRAKTLTHLLAEAAVKAGVRKNESAPEGAPFSPDTRHPITELGKVYLESRAADWERQHLPPDDKKHLSPGHAQNRALRKVGKAILLDLWKAGGEA